jgi:hypothetical protein
LLSENGVKFDAIGQDLRADGHNLEDVDELENDFESLRTDPEASASPSNASHSQADRLALYSDAISLLRLFLLLTNRLSEDRTNSFLSTRR